MIELRLYSAMAKVFLNDCPARYIPIESVEGLKGERVSAQLSYRGHNAGTQPLLLRVKADVSVRVREVRQVPVQLAANAGTDDDYLSKAPGLYPDLLADPSMTDRMRPARSGWQTLWLDIDPKDAQPGEYPIELTLMEADGSIAGQTTLRYTLLPFELPAPELIHTKWFHMDALCDYYHVPALSNAHWAIAEKFMKKAVELGINMILTPIHTPPLDTDIGRERTAVQLVDITVTNGRYAFGFDSLKRYIDMALRCGIQYFEMAHLFTQWGANCAPQIIATVDGEKKRIFGWESPANGEYRQFLAEYLPALVQALRTFGVLDRCYFHISDEPQEDMLEVYQSAKQAVEPYLEGLPIMDAMSTLSFYERGICSMPIPANNHIGPFLEANVPNLWTYYCCSQGNRVSNLFIAMPSERTRVLGVQLYLYQIKGFLQWGFNYYYAQNSRYLIDPYRVTDGDQSWPAGDPFQVYPGENGEPLDSIRAMTVKTALYDLAAFQALEKKIGREKVCALIQEGVPSPITFSEYPRYEQYFTQLRKRVNAALCAHADS